jgi:cytidylate kinase
MTASVDTRAKRRYDELVLKDSELSIHAVLDNIKSRDFLDSTRKESPLFKADDAIEIDNSNLSKKEQFDLVVKLVNTKLNA